MQAIVRKDPSARANTLTKRRDSAVVSDKSPSIALSDIEEIMDLVIRRSWVTYVSRLVVDVTELYD